MAENNPNSNISPVHTQPLEGLGRVSLSICSMYHWFFTKWCWCPIAWAWSAVVLCIGTLHHTKCIAVCVTWHRAQPAHIRNGLPLFRFLSARSWSKFGVKLCFLRRNLTWLILGINLWNDSLTFLYVLEGNKGTIERKNSLLFSSGGFNCVWYSIDDLPVFGPGLLDQRRS